MRVHNNIQHVFSIYRYTCVYARGKFEMKIHTCLSLLNVYKYKLTYTQQRNLYEKLVYSEYCAGPRIFRENGKSFSICIQKKTNIQTNPIFCCSSNKEMMPRKKRKFIYNLNRNKWKKGSIFCECILQG